MFLFIKPSDWGRQAEKVDQALARLADLERRVYMLILALVAGLFTLAAAIISAVVVAVMSR